MPKKSVRKVKMVLYLHNHQADALRKLAIKEDKPISRLIREAVDMVLKHYKKGAKK